MITFTMKILNYDRVGSYIVEYIPDKQECTPVKLTIDVGRIRSTDKNEILKLLKRSSPQNYWKSELAASISGNHETLMSLVNTTHTVEEEEDLSTVRVGPDGTITRNALPGSTPETVVTPAVFNRTQLKSLIQEALREMAEGTV